MSTDLKLFKAQILKIIQSGGFLGRLLGPSLKTGLPLIKNVIKPLAKSFLIPLGLTASASAADIGIHKKILGSGTTTLILSNEEMNDIIKVAQALEDSNILRKGVTKTIINETKEQKGGFLSMLLDTLGASLSGNLLTGKGIVRTGTGKGIAGAGTGKGIERAGTGKGIVRAGTGNHFFNNKEWDQYRFILYETLKYKNIIRMNQDLMVFFQEIISLQK